MKRFTTCYIIEISGTALNDIVRIEHLEKSVNDLMENLLPNFLQLPPNEFEQITIRAGQTPCDEKKNIKAHICLKKIKLRQFDKQ